MGPVGPCLTSVLLMRVVGGEGRRWRVWVKAGRRWRPGVGQQIRLVLGPGRGGWRGLLALGKRQGCRRLRPGESL